MNMSNGDTIEFPWREPGAPDLVHVLVLTDVRIYFSARPRANGNTRCGIAPVGEVTAEVTDITCEACLASMGGDALDEAERLLRESREPVAA